MKLNQTALEYYRRAGNLKIEEINSRLRAEVMQLIARFKGKSYLANMRNKALADFYVKYWEQIVNARIKTFVETYERYSLSFDDDDIENFLQEQQIDSRKNWIAELVSSEKNASGGTPTNSASDIPWPEILNATMQPRLSINNKTREKLLGVMRMKVQEQIEDRTATQNPIQDDVQITKLKFDETLNSLLRIINNDTTLDKYQKEDTVDALNKLPVLALEEQTETVIKRAKDRLELAQSLIDISKDLKTVTAPYLLIIAQYFRLPS